MTLKIIYSPRPKCKTCNKLMESWNPFADTHEHTECAADRISDKLMDIVKKEFNKMS